MVWPLVSVASVRVSLTVRTKQVTDTGAVRWWSETLTVGLYGAGGGEVAPLRRSDCASEPVRYNRSFVIAAGPAPMALMRCTRP